MRCRGREQPSDVRNGRLVPFPLGFLRVWKGDTVNIDGYRGPRERDRIVAPNVGSDDQDRLRSAIAAARSGDAGPAVLWELPRRSGALRGAARVVLGVGSFVLPLLLLALLFVEGGAIAAVLAASVALLVIGGGFVALVWRLDVGITVHGDGTMRRAGWGGERTVDLRAYERVAVNGDDVA